MKVRSGYLYVLKNQAFGANVLKIGLTTRTPDVRAREIYTGSTGVPLPFQVAVAFSVADCARAEKLAHSRLKVYRLNRRREFFRLPLQVGAEVVHEVCTQVNKELGTDAPARFEFPRLKTETASSAIVVYDPPDESDGRPVFHFAPEQLIDSPIQTPVLSDEHRDRANILFHVLRKTNPGSLDDLLDGFMRDEHPERELRIWEHMAIAYLTLEGADDAPEQYRAEAFDLLLQRSLRSTAEVLSSVSLKHFSVANAKRLLDAYALRPKPIVVRLPRRAQSGEGSRTGRRL